MRKIAFWRAVRKVAGGYYFVFFGLMVFCLFSNLTIKLDMGGQVVDKWYSVTLDVLHYSLNQETQILIIEIFLVGLILGRLVVKYGDIDL